MINKIFQIPLYVKSFVGEKYIFFINTHIGTWAAIPIYHANTLRSCLGRKIRTADIEDSEFVQIYIALAKSNIIVDESLNRVFSNASVCKPLLVKFQTTEKCNFACKYCFNETQSRCGEMSEDTIHKAIDFVFDYPASVNGIHFTIYGGEPLSSRCSLYSAIKYIRSKEDQRKNIRISVITNGSLLTDEDVEFFKAHDIRLTISIDGMPEINDKYRVDINGRPTSQSVFSKLDLLKDYPVLNVLAVTTAGASPLLAEIAEFFQSQNLCSIEFRPCRMLGSAGNQTDMQVNVAQYVNSLKQITNMIEEGKLFDINIRTIIRLLLPLLCQETIHGNIGNFRCGAGRNTLIIYHDGKIRGCDMIPEAYSSIIGSIDQGITDLGELDEATKLYAVDNECKKCTFFVYCRGGCPGASASDMHSFGKRHSLDCSIKKVMYPFLLEKLANKKSKIYQYFWQHVSISEDNKAFTC